MHPDRISVVILAAGRSSRFGSQKMHYLLKSSKTILTTSIEQYQKAFSHITIVINNDVQLKQLEVELGVNVVIANLSDQGMSQSLIAGIQSQKNADAWLIALGDMPYVKAETLDKLALEATTSNIIVPLYKGRRGNPVLFGSDFQQGLLSLQGDVGAKKLLNKHKLCVLEVPVDDNGVVHDIDYPEDVL